MPHKISDYLTGIPKPADLTPGLVLVHNQVQPARRLGTRGFRAWEQKLDDTLERCPCSWMPELGVHYRVKAARDT